MLKFDEDFGHLSFTFGGRLHTLRRMMGLTQEDVARSVGVSRALISAFENERRSPTVEIAQSLADTLGVPREDLLSVVVSRRTGREVEVHRLGHQMPPQWRR